MQKPDFILPSDVRHNDIDGNDWADELAGQAATYAELPIGITTFIIEYKNIAIRVQNDMFPLCVRCPTESNMSKIRKPLFLMTPLLTCATIQNTQCLNQMSQH